MYGNVCMLLAGKRKRMLKEMWPKDEVSTRNCFNLKVEGDKASCRYWEFPLLAKNTICTSRLLRICRNCEHFDNEW